MEETSLCLINRKRINNILIIKVIPMNEEQFNSIRDAYVVTYELPDGRKHQVIYKNKAQYDEYLNDINKYEESEEYKESQRRMYGDFTKVESNGFTAYLRNISDYDK